MRIYTNPVEMVKEVERDLFEMGSRYQSATVQDKIVKDNPDYQTIELIGTGYKLDLTSEKLDITSEMDSALTDMVLYKKDEKYLKWVKEEAKERLLFKPQNPGAAWLLDKDTWLPFIRNGLFSYTYSERWSEQIKYLLAELDRNPNTRQAIITMYDRHQDMMNWGGLDRVPCSLSYHFLLRNNRLTLIYNQRSCDFVNFFQADVYITIQLQLYVCKAIGVRPGMFVHNINSLHAFYKDIKDVF